MRIRKSVHCHRNWICWNLSSYKFNVLAIGLDRIISPGSTSQSNCAIVKLCHIIHVTRHSALLPFVSFCTDYFVKPLLSSSTVTQRIMTTAFPDFSVEKFVVGWEFAMCFASTNVSLVPSPSATRENIEDGNNSLGLRFFPFQSIN